MSPKQSRLRVGVVGAPGYSGEETVKILSGHSAVQITYVSGKEDRNQKIQDMFPYLENKLDLDCAPFSLKAAIDECDFIFLALPHTAATQFVPHFMAAKKKVVDVSADYRLKDVTVYEKYYKTKHLDSVNLGRAVYGLPEINRAKIRKASLVANPGCYPTGSILGLLPGLKKGLFDPKSIFIDAKSGVTGAGRKAEKSLNFSEVNENFKAYKVFEHQHVPEINQELSLASKKNVGVTFVPHLLPLNRGILCTFYVRLTKKIEMAELLEVYDAFYKKEPFVKIYRNGTLPELKHVVNTNDCAVGLRVDEKKKLAVIVSVIDNLVKGAAGQAVQNMNLMCGFNEAEGLV